MGILYIVATPIGNLQDITIRALEILKEADLILCEDQRVTRKLLAHYQINTRTSSYHQHSNLQKLHYIINFLQNGKKIALVSDSGTPGISDPGEKLIAQALKECKNLIISPIPGSSALVSAASISGFPMEKFLFLGFPPTKKKRKRFFEEIGKSKYPVIFYESPYRILKTLNELDETIRKFHTKSIQIAACRELTKKFETVYRGEIGKVIEKIKEEGARGEFTVVVGK